MNYLMISRYTIYALIVMVSSIFTIGATLALVLFMQLAQAEDSASWTWGTLELGEDNIVDGE